MSVVLYAVTDAQESDLPAELPFLQRLACGPVAAVYEEREAPLPRDRESMLEFAAGVRTLAEHLPLLPVRYGTEVADVDALAELLAENADTWRGRLDVVRGHVELVVHVSEPEAPVPTPSGGGSGREYLLSRAAVLRHETSLVEEVERALGETARECRALRDVGRGVRVACLVPEDGRRAFDSALASWVGARDGRHVEVTGPWPPFSFTEEPS